MDDFKRMAVFAAVVEQGSMTAAGRALGLSASAVSQQIRQLEAAGGVTLLTRSTRQLSLTDAGQRFYEQCAAMTQAAARAQAELAAARDEPGGELRVATVVGFARHIAPALGGWLAAHPQLRLHMAVDDAPIDLIQSRIDLAIRFGRLPDSSWAAKRLGATPWWLCAAPVWLAGRAADALSPAQLLAGDWLDLVHAGDTVRTIHASRGAETQAWQPQMRITSNNQLSIQQMCEAGLGVALLTGLDAAEAVATGRLARLLPDWGFGTLDIWAVTPQRATQPAKVRQAIAVLQAYLGQLPSVVDAAQP